MEEHELLNIKEEHLAVSIEFHNPIPFYNSNNVTEGQQSKSAQLKVELKEESFEINISNSEAQQTNNITGNNVANKNMEKRNESKQQDAGPPYNCELCEKRFLDKRALIRHGKIHTDSLHICEICKKGFKYKCYLKEHQRTHSDETPYECDVCHWKCKSSGNLNRHKRRHTGEAPYECDICHKRFKASSDRLKHMRYVF